MRVYCLEGSAVELRPPVARLSKVVSSVTRLIRVPQRDVGIEATAYEG